MNIRLFIILSLLFFHNDHLWAEEYFPPVFEDLGPSRPESGGSVIKDFGAKKDEDFIKQGFMGGFTVGAAGVALNNRSAKFGEYSGIEDTTGFVVGGLDLIYNRGPYFMELLASNSGLDNRTLILETGKAGDYSFEVSFDQTPHQLSTNSKSVWEGVGGDTLTLAPGFVTSSTTAGQTISLGSEPDLEIDGRNTLNLGFSKSTGNKEYKLSFKREDKNGVQSLGAAVGNHMNTRSSILPAPVDQTTSDLNASFIYSGENTQFQLDYLFSLYENHADKIIFEDPFGVVDNGSGLISQAPDTYYHKLSFSGGKNFSETTRMTGILEYGLMKNNESLLPFAFGNAATAPRSNAEAYIHTFHFNLKLASNPVNELGLSAQYKHYQTLNETPKTLFLNIVNDASPAVSENSVEAINSQPYDYIQDQLSLNGSYRILKATSFNLGYDIELFQRDLRDVSKTLEQTFDVGIKSNYFSKVNGRIGFTYANRIANAFDPFSVFQSRHSEAFLATSPSKLFDTTPDMRTLDLANRERIKLAGDVGFLPVESVFLGVGYAFHQDDFNDTSVGIKMIRNQTVSINMDYSPDETKSFYSFYSFDTIFTDQVGREWSATADAIDPANDYSVNHDDVSHTVGIGSRFVLPDKKLSLSASYAFTQSVSDISFAANSDVTFAGENSLPDLKTSRHNLEFSGEYHYRNNLALGLTYLYENFFIDNWSLDRVNAASSDINQVLLLSDPNPDYQAHVTMIYATYQLGGK